MAPSFRVLVVRLLPSLALVVVAALQNVSAKLGVLSPWKGGGFGMFSSTDGAYSRIVRISAEGERGRVLVANPPRKALNEARIMPTDGILRQLATEVIAMDRPEGFELLRIKVDRIKIDRITLKSHEWISREFRIHSEE